MFFLVVFTLISLLSYSASDPSINNATAGGQIHNLFGVIGAHLSGLLIGLFGIGAFWVPVILLLASIQFFGVSRHHSIGLTLLGGVLLVMATGSLLAFRHTHMMLLGTRFSSGGLIGISLHSFLVKYTNVAGGLIIMGLVWLIGIILATRFSLVASGSYFWRGALFVVHRIQTALVKWRERRAKARKRIRTLKARQEKKARDVEIKVPEAKPIKDVPAPKQEVFAFMRGESGFQLPSVNFLDDPEKRPSGLDDENLRMQSKLLEKKLEDFGVKGTVVSVLSLIHI